MLFWRYARSEPLKRCQRASRAPSCEPRDFGAAGTACAVAAGHAAVAVATGLDRAWSLSGRTACRCSVLHRGCVRALCDGCSSSMAADRWPTSIPCQGTSLVQRRPVGCALVSHGAAACVKYGHIFSRTLYYSDTLRPLWATPWPGELEGASLAMTQAKVPPVPALSPMFWVSPVLRSVPSALGGAADGRRNMTHTSTRRERATCIVTFNREHHPMAGS